MNYLYGEEGSRVDDFLMRDDSDTWDEIKKIRSMSESDKEEWRSRHVQVANRSYTLDHPGSVTPPLLPIHALRFQLDVPKNSSSFEVDTVSFLFSQKYLARGHH